MSDRIFTIISFPETSYYKPKLEMISDFLRVKGFNLVLQEISRTDGIDKIIAKIEESDLIFVETLQYISHHAEILNVLKDWVDYGGKIIFNVSYQSTYSTAEYLRIEKQFLKTYGIIQNGIKLRPKIGYDVEFKADSDAYKERHLFRKVNSIIITQPNHIDCKGKAEHILVNKDDQYLDVTSGDYITELSKGAWPMAIFEDEKLDSILVAFSGVFENLENESDNGILFINIFKYLLGKPSTSELAYRIFSQIESNLARNVKSILEKEYSESDLKRILEISLGKDLFDDSANSVFTTFNFLHLKKIISKNWDLFAQYFTSDTGKKKALKWMGKINNYRNDIMHPVKSLNDKKITYKVVKELFDIKSSQKILSKRII